jgi:putative oxidoreductase
VTSFRAWAFGTRTHGTAAWATAAVRVVTGVLFVLFSLGKFVDHAKESADFAHYGIPAPEVATYFVGALELLGGLLLIVGLLTRPVALLLAANLVGAIATAGRVDGGSFHLGVAPTMLAAMLFLLWAGSGRPAVDTTVATVGRPTQSVADGRTG